MLGWGGKLVDQVTGIVACMNTQYADPPSPTHIHTRTRLQVRGHGVPGGARRQGIALLLPQRLEVVLQRGQLCVQVRLVDVVRDAFLLI